MTIYQDHNNGNKAGVSFTIAIVFLVAIAVFCNTRDYMGEWSFRCWMREFNVSYVDFDCKFSEAVYCGNYVWCGERFLFARGEMASWIIPYERLKRIEGLANLQSDF